MDDLNIRLADPDAHKIAEKFKSGTIYKLKLV